PEQAMEPDRLHGPQEHLPAHGRKPEPHEDGEDDGEEPDGPDLPELLDDLARVDAAERHPEERDADRDAEPELPPHPLRDPPPATREPPPFLGPWTPWARPSARRVRRHSIAGDTRVDYQSGQRDAPPARPAGGGR